jgi:predicted DNA-binding ribbon-helix-helix protein
MFGTEMNRSQKSPVVKRSVVLGGHRTSVSLEDAFWSALKGIAEERGIAISALVGAIDAARSQSNLSSALRLFVLDHYRVRSRAAAEYREAFPVQAAGGLPQAVVQ